jgi:hypothetical protein
MIFGIAEQVVFQLEYKGNAQKPVTLFRVSLRCSSQTDEVLRVVLLPL